MTNHHHHGCCACGHEEGNGPESKGQKLVPEQLNLKQEILPLIGVAIATILALIFQPKLAATPYSLAEYLVFIPLYLISGWGVIISAGRNILKGQIFDENFLMSAATMAAIAIGELPEAVAVMLFYQIGELFQEYSVKRSRNSIKSLLEIRPDYANLKIGNSVEKVDPETVEPGSIVAVKAGEKIPLDGEVIEGKASVDTSPLTGESVPREKTVGDTVLAGTLNQNGLLTIRVTKAFGESSISRILTLVETAKSKKSKTEKFITTFARYYTPAVVFISLAIAFLPPLFIAGADGADWIVRGLIVLVVSCPCGLVISIPLGYFGGVGGAAKRGILVKGSTFLDDLAAVKTVVFDKTGTLTEGVFEVKEIIPKNGFKKEDLISIAARVESLSNHPVAKAVVRHAEKLNLMPEKNGNWGNGQVEDYEEIAGCGVKAKVKNQTVIVGGDRLLHLENIEHDICEVGGTAVHLAVDCKYAGYILIGDRLKADARAAIDSLKKLGITETVMLTGDDGAVAEKVADKLGLTSYRARLLPEDKVEAIEALINQKSKVAFVGDGINDAPVIARADVGIAMGGMGADAAIETADVVIMTDAPSKVAEAILMGKKTRRIVWQNIAFAMGVKALFIILAILGMATIWGAVFADVGVALIAVFNASRILENNSASNN
ncbi:MAG: heavy metal translocating P-type ATPase [Cyanobacteriota bacterium]|nr:heavy metal translocating P-type ATPase [Cyanobacteriota bacterium]